MASRFLAVSPLPAEHSRVREPQQGRSRRSKQAILNAALERFSAGGYQSTTSKDIAAAAGVGIGTFYAYYPDKLALFRDCFAIYNERFNARLTELLRDLDMLGTSRRAVLRRFVDALIAAHDVYVGFHNELVIMILSNPEFMALSLEKRRASRQTIQTYIERAQNQLAVRDPEAMAVILFDLFHSVTDTLVFGYSDTDRERVIESLLDMVEHGICGK